MTKLVRRYMRLVARIFILGGTQQRLENRKDALWDRMTQKERDVANKLVQIVFGEWL